MAGCGIHPLRPYDTAAPPMMLVPVQHTAVQDARPRFREIFCAVLAARTPGTPPAACASVLVQLSDEAPGPGRPVVLAPSGAGLQVLVVLGLASDCADQVRAIRAELLPALAAQGYPAAIVPLPSLTSSADSARRLRDALMALPAPPPEGPRVVLVGHSKGVVDSLQALVDHPEIRPRVAALVSLAGAVGGSPLANLAPDELTTLLHRAPGLACEAGDGLALDSLRPALRQRWLAEHRLPGEVDYYSLVAAPAPAQVSIGLRPGYAVLSRIDGRNDGNVLSQDQLIPQGTLLGLVNADHWAVMSPLQQSPLAAVRALADRNDFPRAALVEAALRFIEERQAAWR